MHHLAVCSSGVSFEVHSSIERLPLKKKQLGKIVIYSLGENREAFSGACTLTTDKMKEAHEIKLL